MATNRYKVPAKKWKKWSAQAREVFNQLFCTMKHNQELFLYPGDEPRTARRWQTTCFNAAWLAADFTDLHGA